MLAPDEEPEALERLEQLTDPGETRRTAAVKSRAAAEAGFLAGVEAAAASSAAKSSTSGTSAPVPGAPWQKGTLRTLAQCRALSMDAYVRAMLKLDPDFDPLSARQENFPQVAPGKDLEGEAKSLHQSGLLSLEDLQTALEVIRRQAGEQGAHLPPTIPALPGSLSGTGRLQVARRGFQCNGPDSFARTSAGNRAA